MAQGESPLTEQKNQLASLFAACWKDEALKARFMSDPKAVLAEYDMPVPDGMDVKVVENADNCVHITMPAAPSGSGELSDEELSNAHVLTRVDWMNPADSLTPVSQRRKDQRPSRRTNSRRCLRRVGRTSP